MRIGIDARHAPWPPGLTPVGQVEEAAQRGLEGTISGQLRSDMLGLSTTAAQWKAALLALRTKAATGQQMWLTAGDSTIPVVVRSIKVTPRPEPILAYDASFEFYQVSST